MDTLQVFSGSALDVLQDLGTLDSKTASFVFLVFHADLLYIVIK